MATEKMDPSLHCICVVFAVEVSRVEGFAFVFGLKSDSCLSYRQVILKILDINAA